MSGTNVYDKYRYTLFEELADAYHVMTPNHCFEKYLREYLCKLQKKEFIFRFDSSNHANHQTFNCGEDSKKNFKLIAITTNQCFSNFQGAVPIRLLHETRLPDGGSGLSRLSGDKVYYGNECVHDVIFPGPSLEKRVLHQSVTSTSLEIDSSIKTLNMEDIWEGSIDVQIHHEHEADTKFLPFNGCTISHLFAVLDAKKIKGYHNGRSGYFVSEPEQSAMEDYIKKYDQEKEVTFQWHDLKIEPTTVLTSEDKFCLIRVQVYYYEDN